jgi:hypothetical protein
MDGLSFLHLRVAVTAVTVRFTLLSGNQTGAGVSIG